MGTFNRTIVELKQFDRINSFGTFLTFNRTIVELKHFEETLHLIFPSF